MAELFLKQKSFQVKAVETINTHISCPITFFSENTAVYEILCKSIVKPDKPHMTIKYGASALHAR